MGVRVMKKRPISHPLHRLLVNSDHAAWEFPSAQLLLAVVAMSLFSEQAIQEVLVQGVINSGRTISLNLAQSQETLQSFQLGEETRLLPLLQQHIHLLINQRLGLV